MYFAIEPTHNSLPTHIWQTLTNWRSTYKEAPSAHLFALIDGAFNEAFITAQKLPRQPKLSLYEYTALQPLGAAAPHLLTAPSKVSEQLAWLEKLFDACSGSPMLSIIASTLSADALQQHFQPYLIARTPDNIEWPVRWADTRILPEFINALDAAQRIHLLSPLVGWWTAQRDGSPISWRNIALSANVPNIAPANFDKLPLSDTAFASLVDAAEADAILGNLHDSQPDVLRQHSPSQSHARVSKHLVIASANGIEAAGKREHFGMLSLILAEDFTQHAAMATFLQRTRQGADYFTEINALPASFWQETAMP